MTFDEAKDKLLLEGYSEKFIRRMKVHLSEPWEKTEIDRLNQFQAEQRAKFQRIIKKTNDEVEKERALKNLAKYDDLPPDAGVGVWLVYEDGPDKAAIRKSDGSLSDPSKIIRYRLDQGSLNSAREEFWVPCAYDGIKGWEEYYCAPHWKKTAQDREGFCKKHYGDKSWPDEKGEVAEDPIRFINSELSLLRSSNQFKGSFDIDEKFREKSVSNMRMHSKQAFEYLSKAVALSLERNEPENRQVSQEKLRDNYGMTPFVDAAAVRIIELAFRAGREAATSSLHYRGIPVEAEQGKPLSDGQSKAGPKKEWTKTALEFLLQNPRAKSADIARHLKDASILDWEPQGPYRGAHTIFFYDGTPDKSRRSFQNAVSKLKKT